MNFLTDKMGQHFWIGANDIDIEDDWIWESDKSKLLFSDWHVDQPNRDDEDCGNMKWYNSQYKWNDNECYHVSLYICEK
jgi:hypothetical protein